MQQLKFLSMDIGIDIGATKMMGLVFNSESKMVHYHVQYPTPHNVASFQQTLNTIFSSLVGSLQGKALHSIGVAAAGKVSVEGAVQFPHIPELGNAPLREWVLSFAREKGVPDVSVFMENDAKLYTLAEYLLGAAQGKYIVIGITLGSGLGGGIIINGSLYHGADDTAGEFGHMVMDHISGTTWEQLCSKQFFASIAAGTDPEDLEHRARAGEAAAHEQYQKFGHHLGVGLANILNAFNPDSIVLGGGLAQAADLFLPETQTTIQKLLPYTTTRDIRQGMFIHEGAALGAALAHTLR